MPGGYTENAKKWLELSEIDYVGPFVKAWLAFNAWYRSVYTHRSDRAILDDFRWSPNVIRNKLVPLIGGSGEEAEQFRAQIGSLHHRLEGYHIHSGHSGDWERITFSNVFLRTQSPGAQTLARYGWTHTITPGAGNPAPLTIDVARPGTTAFNAVHQRYDVAALQSDPNFLALTADQRGTLLSVYSRMNPRLIVDLTSNAGSQILCGAYHFYCSPEELFAGLCEIVYSMRCCLFHGELVPDPDAVACYEPAYKVVRRFLSSIA